MGETRVESERTEIQIFANPDDENTRSVLLRAWTLINCFPSIGSWNTALMFPDYQEDRRLAQGKTPYQNCHARLGRTTNNQKERDDEADSNADLDTPDNCKEKCKIHERQVNPCAHPAFVVLGRS